MAKGAYRVRTGRTLTTLLIKSTTPATAATSLPSSKYVPWPLNEEKSRWGADGAGEGSGERGRPGAEVGHTQRA